MGGDSKKEKDRTGNGESEHEQQDEEFDAIAAARELESTMSDDDELGQPAEASGGYIEILEGEINALNQDLRRAHAAQEAAEARAERVLAEVERSKERLAREARRDVERRSRDVLLAFLDVADDLDRAIASARAMDHNPEVLAGVDLVRRRLTAKLAELGVSQRPAAGERFDPSIHEALTTVAVDDAARDGTVVEVISEGYDIDGEVLRPARVAVGKKS